MVSNTATVVRSGAEAEIALKLLVLGDIIHTGDRTYFGSPAASIVGQRQLTSFDKGINQFT